MDTKSAFVALFVLIGLAVVAAQEFPPTDPTPAAAALPRPRKYLPQGRGLDWSLSGYREGRAVVPDPPPTLNVQTQFGAKGDGATDDTAALLAAVSAANRNPQGGVVFLPAGTYIVSRPLVVTRAGVVIRGAGQGRTIIHIPVSLSDVYQGTWSTGPDGSVSSQWSFGGAFISFTGAKQGTTDGRSLLAVVSAPVATGDTRIPVDSTARLRVGQRIRIYVNDASTLGRDGRSNLQPSTTVTAMDIGAAALDDSTAASVRPQPAQGWLQEDPVFQAALEAKRTLGDGGMGGLNPEEALLADSEAYAGAAKAAASSSDVDHTAWPAAAPPPGGALPPVAADAGGVLPNQARMAAGNSVVAWLYGENMVDSGQAQAVDRDEVSVPARVAAMGAGWIQLERGIPFPVKPGWQGEVHWDAPTLLESGIEALTVRFKHTLAPLHFADRGFNAVQFTRGSNCWARNLTILNADNGLLFSWMDRSTIRGVTVGTTVPRVNPASPGAHNGHHAISLTNSHANLVASWQISNRYIHDLTLASGASLNVLSDGGGVDCNIDLHRAAPHGNLFTDLNLGLGARPFASGGRSDRGAHSGRLNTFWNVRAGSGAALALPPCDFGPLLGFFGSYRGDACASKLWVVQPLQPDAPPNLYIAQRELRRQREAAAL